MKYTKKSLKDLAEECAQCIHTCPLNEQETAKYLYGIFKEAFLMDMPEEAAKRMKEHKAIIIDTIA